MILINNVFLPLDTDFLSVDKIVAECLKVPLKEIYKAFLYKKSVDARKKDAVAFCCSFVAELPQHIERRLISKSKNVTAFEKKDYAWY